MPNKKKVMNIKKVIAGDANFLNKRNSVYQMMLINTEYWETSQKESKTLLYVLGYPIFLLWQTCYPIHTVSYKTSKRGKDPRRSNKNQNKMKQTSKGKSKRQIISKQNRRQKMRQQYRKHFTTASKHEQSMPAKELNNPRKVNKYLVTSNPGIRHGL